MPKRNRAREQRRNGAGAGPPQKVVCVATNDDACALAARLLDPGRTWPVVVVSTAADTDGAYVDVHALKAEVGELAEVVLVPTGATSWAFSSAMPPRTQVYGGASRVYGTEQDWVADPFRSRLRFAYTTTDGERVRELLVHDALAAAQRAGLVGSSAPARVDAKVTGTVRGIIGKRALVDLDDDGQAAVAEELTGTGAPLAQVLVPGQRVSGALDDVSRLLDVAAALPDDAASRRLVDETYRSGDVVLVRVRDAGPDAVTVELAPRVACRVPREHVTGNDLDRVDDLFSPGEVVLARTVASPGGLTVRLDDVDDADDVPVPALALLPGGPPWRCPPRPGFRPGRLLACRPRPRRRLRRSRTPGPCRRGRPPARARGQRCRTPSCPWRRPGPGRSASRRRRSRPSTAPPSSRTTASRCWTRSSTCGRRSSGWTTSSATSGRSTGSLTAVVSRRNGGKRP